MKGYIWFLGLKIFWFFAHPKNHFIFILRNRLTNFTKKEKRPAPDYSQTQHKIPKKIWIYWAQGWDKAPRLTQACRASWIRQNPSWEVISLDNENIEEYVTITPALKKEIPPIWQSDLLRVYLLEKYGGVWVDATTLCVAPLDTWISAVLKSGFFAFDKPKTTFASWFLIAEKENALLRSWREGIDTYWKYVHHPRENWIFYVFEYLLITNKKMKDDWADTAYISSEGSYAVQNFLKCSSIDEESALAHAVATTAPVHKLNWKIDIPDAFLQKMEERLHS